MDLYKIPFVVSFGTQASAGIKYGVPRYPPLRYPHIPQISLPRYPGQLYAAHL